MPEHTPTPDPRSHFRFIYFQSWGWNQGLELLLTTELLPSPADSPRPPLLGLGLTLRVRDSVLQHTRQPAPPSPCPVSWHFCFKIAAARLRDPGTSDEWELHSEFPPLGKICKWEPNARGEAASGNRSRAGASWPCHLSPPPAPLSLHTRLVLGEKDKMDECAWCLGMSPPPPSLHPSPPPLHPMPGKKTQTKTTEIGC